MFIYTPFILNFFQKLHLLLLALTLAFKFTRSNDAKNKLSRFIQVVVVVHLVVSELGTFSCTFTDLVVKSGPHSNHPGKYKYVTCSII